MKTCTKCGLSKPLSDFTSSARTRTGKTARCKACTNLYHKARFEAGLASTADYFNRLVYMKRHKCAGRGVPFNLTADYLRTIWTDRCPVFGMLLIRGDRRSDANATLDRTDPALGYVEGNVVFMSALANRIKSNVTDPAFLRKVADYLEHTNGPRADY